MSDTYELACTRCEKKIWIGQSQNSDPPFCFYRGNEDTMKALGLFLWEHRGHPLLMEDSQYLEIEGIAVGTEELR